MHHQKEQGGTSAFRAAVDESRSIWIYLCEMSVKRRKPACIHALVDRSTAVYMSSQARPEHNCFPDVTLLSSSFFPKTRRHVRPEEKITFQPLVTFGS